MNPNPSRLFMFPGVLILAGLIARLWLWWNFTGCTDSHIWAGHAAHIATKGLELTYEQAPTYNHPPLMGYLASLWFHLAGGDKFDILVFARWLKLPAMAAEMGIIALLWRFTTPFAAAIYALSPVAILISAFHGNTDALCAALIMTGTLAAGRDRWFLAGALFAAALNVKLIPLLLLPILVPSAPWRALPRLAGGLALSVIPFIVPALSSAAAMRRNLLEYNPPINGWGVMAFLGAGTSVPNLGLLKLWESWYSANGRFVLLGAIITFAIWAKYRTRLRVAEQVAVVLALWLILTPGLGIQYFIYVLPLFCVVNRRYAILWSGLAGTVLAIDYWIGLANPVPAGTSWVPPFPTAGPALLFGIIAWTLLIRFVGVTMIRTGRQDESGARGVRLQTGLQRWRSMKHRRM